MIHRSGETKRGRCFGSAQLLRHFQTETAYLLLNDEGYFVLVGVPAEPQWSEPQVVPSEVFSEDLEGDDDLDFEMF